MCHRPLPCHASLAILLFAACALGGCAARPRPRHDLTREREIAGLLQRALQDDAPQSPTPGPATGPGAITEEVLRVRGEGFRIECPPDRSAWLVTDDGARLNLVSADRQQAWERMLRLGARQPVDARALQAAADDLLITAATSEVPEALARVLRQADRVPRHESLARVARQILNSGIVAVYDANSGEAIASAALTELDRRSISDALAGGQPPQAEVAPSR